MPSGYSSRPQSCDKGCRQDLEWQPQFEFGATDFRAIDAQSASVKLDNFGDDGQTNALARYIAPRLSAFAAVEYFFRL